MTQQDHFILFLKIPRTVLSVVINLIGSLLRVVERKCDLNSHANSFYSVSTHLSKITLLKAIAEEIWFDKSFNYCIF